MKKLLLGLFVVACGTTLSAQVSTKATTVEATKTEKVKPVSPEQSKLISAALMQDESLQASAVRYLETDKSSKGAMAKIAQANKGGMQGTIKAILADENLSAKAIRYINDNPELAKKVLSVMGM